MKNQGENKWFKNRGYLHLSPKLNLDKDRAKILNKINNPAYIAKHAFFPLIHSNIKERRYKKDSINGVRSHTKPSGESNAKIRPLHFATHIDSMIFGCYADKLKFLYEKLLSNEPGVSESVIAYRQIPDPKNTGKNKSTIHFAHEAFQYIKSKAEEKGEYSVLKFDIEKFFSGLNHRLLKDSWANLLGKPELPLDHYMVFRASTNFSYVLKDDLRLYTSKVGRKAGFDEKRLAENRKLGIESFFGNAKEFREALKSGQVKVFKNPFYSKEEKKRKGIPQGLPISAILANLYLLDFDREVVKEIVKKRNGYYRRYSDDILVVIPVEEEDWTNEFVSQAILKSKVSISHDKTEVFRFKKMNDSDGNSIIKGFLKKDGNWHDIFPLNYLGFDFYGHKTLIASKNLSKFYRRMKTSIKKKVNIASKKYITQEFDRSGMAVYKRQLYRIYTNQNLNKGNLTKKRKKLIQNLYGYYHFKIDEHFPPFRGNYLTYIKRAATIMKEPAIQKQLRNHKKIFNQYLKKRIEIEKQRGNP